MKKHIILTLAIAAAAASVPMGVLPAAAAENPELQPIHDTTDMTAQRFVRQYCGLLQKNVNADGGQTETFHWFKEVNEANAAILYESALLFQDLPATMQQEIVELCNENHFDYAGWIDWLNNQLPQQSHSPAEVEILTETAPLETGEQTETPSVEQETGAETAVDASAQLSPAFAQTASQIQQQGLFFQLQGESFDPQGEDKRVIQAFADEMKVNPVAWYRNVQVVVSSNLGEQAASLPMMAIQTDTGQFLFFQSTLMEDGSRMYETYLPEVYSFNLVNGVLSFGSGETFTLSIPETENRQDQDHSVEMEGSMDPGKTTVTEEKPDAVLEAQPVMAIRTSHKEEVQQSAGDHLLGIGDEALIVNTPVLEAGMPVESDSAQDQETARLFVQTWCSENGIVIQEVTTQNYQKILDGYARWSSLGQSVKNAVNALLEASGSVTYQTLYTHANEVLLGMEAPIQKQEPVHGSSANTAVSSGMLSSWLTFVSLLIALPAAALWRKSKRKSV